MKIPDYSGYDRVFKGIKEERIPTPPEQVISGYDKVFKSQEQDVTPKGKEQLKVDEGNRLKVYKDSLGIDTIGVGFNLQEPANKEVFKKVTGMTVEEAKKGKAITQEQSDLLLEHTVGNSEKEVRGLVKNFENLTPDQQDALTNFVFNVGINTAKTFKNTLAAVERGDGKAAAEGIRKSKYYKQVGARGERIAKTLETIKA